MKNKKNLIIVLLSIVVFVLILIIIFLVMPKKSHKIDGSNMSSGELINMFENEQYEFKLTNFSGQQSIYVSISNSKKGITLQKILNTALGTMMTFYDDTINKESADLLVLSDNNTKEKQQQYKAFEDWLKYYNITKLQVSDMLDYYFTIHKNEVEIVDLNAILQK